MFYDRNLGLITINDQQKINGGKVLVAGVGGMGGVCAEVLVRMGIGTLYLVDHDIFEETNFNRQIHSNQSSLGKYKVEVLKEAFLKINPNLNIKVYNEPINIKNVDAILNEVDIVINGMDQMHASLILERKARALKKTIVDAWLTPFASVFVITPNSPHWEDFMNLPTKNVALENLTDEICQQALIKEIEFTFSHFNPFEIISQDIVKEVVSGKRPRPSLAPVVWLSGVLMANEAFKILTNKPHVNHAGIFFDQYNYSITHGNIVKSIKAA